MSDKPAITEEEKDQRWSDAEWTPEADQLSRIADSLEEIQAVSIQLFELLSGAAEAAGEYLAKKDNG